MVRLADQVMIAIEKMVCYMLGREGRLPRGLPEQAPGPARRQQRQGERAWKTLSWNFLWTIWGGRIHSQACLNNFGSLWATEDAPSCLSPWSWGDQG